MTSALWSSAWRSPRQSKLSGGWTRLILRKAMDGLLPASIQWRRDKINFGPHLADRMLACHGALLDALLLGDRQPPRGRVRHGRGSRRLSQPCH